MGSNNCTMLSNEEYDGLVVVQIVLSAISCVLVLCMIGLIVLFKKYQFFTQRLILYVAICSFISNLINAINFFGREAVENAGSALEDLCMAVGFFNQVSFWWELMSVVIIMIDIFIKIAFKRQTEKFELLYVILIISVPLSFSWIPFIKKAYGPAGTFCWIREYNFINETYCPHLEFGIYLRFILYYIPLYILLFLLIILLLSTCCIIRKRRKQWNSQLDYQIIHLEQILVKEIRSLFAYPIIFIVINMIPLAHRIYGIFNTSDTTYFVLSLITVILFSTQGSIIMIAFSSNPETRKKMRWIEIKAAFRRWRGKEEAAIREYLVGESTERAESIIPTNTDYTRIV